MASQCEIAGNHGENVGSQCGIAGNQGKECGEENGIKKKNLIRSS